MASRLRSHCLRNKSDRLFENIMQNTRNPAQLSFIKAFVNEWKIRMSAKAILYLRSSTFGIFSDINFDDTQIVTRSDEINSDSKFDLIIGDLPFGMKQIEIEHQGAKLRVPRNWGEIFKSLWSLGDNGTGLFLLEPLGFSSDAGVKV